MGELFQSYALEMMTEEWYIDAELNIEYRLENNIQESELASALESAVGPEKIVLAMKYFREYRSRNLLGQNINLLLMCLGMILYEADTHQKLNIFSQEIEYITESAFDLLFNGSIAHAVYLSFIMKIISSSKYIKIINPQEKRLDTTCDFIFIKSVLANLSTVSIEALLNQGESVNAIEEQLIILLDYVKKLEDSEIYEIEMLNKCIEYTMRQVRTATLTNEHSVKLISKIDSYKRLEMFPKFTNAAIAIEENIFDYLDTVISNGVDVDLKFLKENCQQMRKEFNQYFNDSAITYFATKVETLPDFDSTLMLFIDNLLKIIFTRPFLDFYQHRFLRLGRRKNFLRIRSKVALIAKTFPPHLQYAIFEILSTIKKNDNAVLEYLCGDVNANMMYSYIDESWANQFVTTATRAPIIELLCKLRTPEFTPVELTEILKAKTPKIIIARLPSTWYGITTKNLTIIIDSHYPEVNQKGFTFWIYLHELGHYLRRFGLSTYEEVASLKKSQELNEKEGGYQLEVDLIGKRISSLTYSLTLFLAELNIPNDIQEFRTIFHELNEREGEQRISMMSKAGVIQIGMGCGTRPIASLSRIKK